MTLRLVTAPAADPITVAELRDYLKIGTDEDTYLAQIIKAAVLHTERETKQRLVIQTWKETFDDFPQTLYLQLAPLRSVTSVKYYNLAGVLTTMTTDDYALNDLSTPGYLEVPYPSLLWPYTQLGKRNAVEVIYTVGYDVSGTITLALPEDLKQAVLYLCGHWYANREPVVVGAGMVSAPVPMTYDWIIAPHRTWLF